MRGVMGVIRDVRRGFKGESRRSAAKIFLDYRTKAIFPFIAFLYGTVWYNDRSTGSERQSNP